METDIDRFSGKRINDEKLPAVISRTVNAFSASPEQA
jgi:hypothetical protein